MNTKRKKKTQNTKIYRAILWSICILAIILPYCGFVYVYKWYHKEAERFQEASVIVIDKNTMELKMFDYKGILKHSYGIACGKNYGNKDTIGDLKTPEGVFHIQQIQDSHSWKHDFNDGQGKIEGAYGPWFIRLAVPGHNGIGIHGTHDSNSIGSRATEGCIRLENSNLEKLVKDVKVGMLVIITPSKEDL